MGSRHAACGGAGTTGNAVVTRPWDRNHDTARGPAGRAQSRPDPTASVPGSCAAAHGAISQADSSCAAHPGTAKVGGQLGVRSPHSSPGWSCVGSPVSRAPWGVARRSLGDGASVTLDTGEPTQRAAGCEGTGRTGRAQTMSHGACSVDHQYTAPGALTNAAEMPPGCLLSETGLMAAHGGTSWSRACCWANCTMHRSVRYAASAGRAGCRPAGDGAGDQLPRVAVVLRWSCPRGRGR